MDAEPIVLPLKRCFTCGLEKPVTEFSKNPQKKDGRHPSCKDCRSLLRGVDPARRRRKARLGYKICYTCGRELPATTEYFHVNKWKGSGLNSQCKECRRQHYFDNWETIRKQNTKASYAWWLLNRERAKETGKKWRINNLSKKRLEWQRYSAHKKAHPENFTLQDWQRCLDWWNGCCAYCGNQQSFWHTIEMEHYIPVSALDCPGTVPSNILPACRECNASKSNKLAEKWLIKKQGRRHSNVVLKRIQEYFAWVERQSD
jgi:hypothetical protein